MNKILAICTSALVLISCSKTEIIEPLEPQGAYYTGVYHNYVSEVLGIDSAQVAERMEQLFDHFFTPGDFSRFSDDDQCSVYYETNDSMAFVYDTGSDDVRTEGMSYGMMICLQMNKPEQFGRLWRWAKTYMRYPDDSPWNGYFCWQCHSDGTRFGNSNASDGEIYFATALYMAAHRWNMPEYAADAQDILDRCMSKDGKHGVWNLYDEATKVVTFVPTDDAHVYTDPSYQLPAFVQLWSGWDSAHHDFWYAAADSARNMLHISQSPVTGLYPDYCTYQGEPFKGPFCSYDSRRFQYDAIRCAMNVGMDYYLFGKDADAQSDMMQKLLSFFKNDNFTYGQFELDGTNPTGNYTEGMAGANAVGAIALKDEALKKEYLERLWQIKAPTGRWRYYAGMVYMLSMLHVTGNFRIY